MKIIGRKREKDALAQALKSPRPEFVAIYGRRRVGKTFLVKEYFNNQFSFYATGLSDEKMKGQLRGFQDSLLQYGSEEKGIPADWFEAFGRLRRLLSSPDVYRDPTSHKIVVFLDELPWMDTQRSDFKSALDYFWNSWASSVPDLVLIVCGSATSWIINNLLRSRKGFHNRITRQIHLLPFSLGECEELLEANDIHMPRNQIMECYMVFGGIPFYLNLLDARLSLAQNIDELCFKSYGELKHEYDNLFYSLFKKPEKHLAIIRALSSSKGGTTRKALSEDPAIGGGSVLTKDLEELEECGFIRSYSNYPKSEKERWYQVIDSFTLFSLRFLIEPKQSSWMRYLHTAGYNAWRGNAFEILCLNHIPQMKAALGISGIDSQEYMWRSSGSEKGAQIDLLIDRSDGVINLCEMKYTDAPYTMNREEYEKLLNRLSVFEQEVNPGKAIHLTLVSANGVKGGSYLSAVQNVITGDDLF